MSQSFYRKEGLDYLYFARPGTSYGRPGDQSESMGMTTRSQFFGASGTLIKPIEMIQSRSMKQHSIITHLWFERAKKTMT
jgi:hypothetical protein